MEDSLSGPFTVVDDHPVGIFEAQVFCDFPGFQHQVTQQCLVFFTSFCKPGDLYFWNDENVGRRLGVDIVKRDAGIVFKDNVGRNFLVDNFSEDRVAHRQLPAVRNVLNRLVRRKFAPIPYCDFSR